MYAEYSSETGIKLSKRDKTYVDISLSWEPNPLNGDITSLRNVRAVNNSLKNIVMTYPLEVPFNPEFGSEVSTMLFDPMDQATAGLMELEIERAIEMSEPRVDLIDVRVTPNDNEMYFVVDIEYQIIGSEQIYIVSQILTPTR